MNFRRYPVRIACQFLSENKLLERMFPIFSGSWKLVNQISQVLGKKSILTEPEKLESSQSDYFTKSYPY